MGCFLLTSPLPGSKLDLAFDCAGKAPIPPEPLRQELAGHLWGTWQALLLSPSKYYPVWMWEHLEGASRAMEEMQPLLMLQARASVCASVTSSA